MGVHGLWQLLQPTGQQVTLESLRGKVLAIDVSVWLHQSMKGMRDRYGNTVHNAHLHFLFKRVSKLLFYGIKPVFVFDGGVPALKLQTIAGRKQKRDDAHMNKEKTAKKLLKNVLKHHAVNAVLGKEQPNVTLPPSQRERDMFELPALLPETDRPLENTSDVDDDELLDERQLYRQELFSEFQNLNDIDVDSEDFKSLPPEVQHEILSELRDSRKHSSWAKIDTLPKDSGDFSAYQVKKLMKQSKLSRKINSVRKELNTCNSGSVGDLLNEEGLGTGIVSNKVASDDTTHYILVKRVSPMKNAAENDLKKNIVKDISNVGAKLLEQVEPEKHSNPIASSVGTDVKAEIQQKDGMCPSHLTKEEPEEIKIEQVELPHGQNPVGDTTDITGPGNLTGNHYNSMSTSNISNEALDEEQQHMVQSLEENSVMTGSVDCDKKDVNKSTKRASESPTLLPTVEKKARIELNEKNNCEAMLEEKETFCDLQLQTTYPNGKIQESGSKSSSKMESTDDEDDSDFIEVTINPDTINSDDLFPASIFSTPAITNNTESVTDTSTNTSIDSFSKNEPLSESQVKSTLQEEPSLDPTPAGEVEEDSATPKQHFKDMSTDDLKDMQATLEKETVSLVKEQGTQERLASSITDQMQKESQELLMLFGVPFVVAPMEAEAQCAFLDLTNQTQGTVTDDSDIWLFGGRSVYRNFFNQNKYVEHFTEKDINNHLMLTRDQMVKLAYLCGCDYTEGVQGIGPVTGLEILLEFPGDEIEGLRDLKEWWTVEHKQPDRQSDTKLKKKLKTFEFSEGFPNPAVFKAFMEPVVDESVDSFTWGKPDLDLLRDFAYDKLAWSKSKVDEEILPVIKEMNKKETQTNITQFMSQTVSKSPVKSKRVNRVLTRIKDNNKSLTQVKGKSSKKFPAKNKKIHKDKESGGFVQCPTNVVSSNCSVNLSEGSSDSD